MGYSCARKASIRLEQVIKFLQNLHGNPTNSSNSWGEGYFYEIGRENVDGSITGKVMKPIPNKPGYCISAGGFKIDPNGDIVRFPTLQKKYKDIIQNTPIPYYTHDNGLNVFLNKLGQYEVRSPKHNVLLKTFNNDIEAIRWLKTDAPKEIETADLILDKIVAENKGN